MSPISGVEVDSLTNSLNCGWRDPALLPTELDCPAISLLLIHLAEKVSAFMRKNETDYVSGKVVQLWMQPNAPSWCGAPEITD